MLPLDGCNRKRCALETTFSKMHSIDFFSRWWQQARKSSIMAKSFGKTKEHRVCVCVTTDELNKQNAQVDKDVHEI